MNTSNKQDATSNIFDLLLNVMHKETDKIGRNDYCFCDSGKKYKKCCIQFEDALDNDVTTQFFDELEQRDYCDDREEIPVEADAQLGQLYDQLVYLAYCEEDEVAQFFKDIDELRRQYPRCPIILNYLQNGYIALEQQDNAERIMHEMFKEFPKYFFSKLIYALMYLQKNDPEKAFDLFNRCTSLKQAFPDRTKFTIQEGAAFQEFLIRYYIKTENLILAERHYRYFKNLTRLYDSESVYEETYGHRRMINALRLKKGMERLSKNMTPPDEASIL